MILKPQSSIHSLCSINEARVASNNPQNIQKNPEITQLTKRDQPGVKEAIPKHHLQDGVQKSNSPANQVTPSDDPDPNPESSGLPQINTDSHKEEIVKNESKSFRPHPKTEKRMH